MHHRITSTAIVLGILLTAIGCNQPGPILAEEPIQLSETAAAGQVRSIENWEQFQKEVLKASKPVMVDFYLTTCPPCDRLAPRLEELAEEYAGRVEFFKVNAAVVVKAKRHCKIYGYPTVILFQKSNEKHRWVGLREKDEFREVLDTIVETAVKIASKLTRQMLTLKPMSLRASANSSSMPYCDATGCYYPDATD